MLVEFFEDYYLERPQEQHDEGTPYITGDPLIDKWESEIAQGLVPDLSEGMAPEDHESLMEWGREVYQKKQEMMTFPKEINEIY